MSLSSPHDSAILQWLHSVPIQAQKVDFRLQKLEVFVNCWDAYLAHGLWLQRSVLQKAGLDLTLFLNGKVVDSTKRMRLMTSAWANQHTSAFIDMSLRCTACVHSEANGYRHLAIQPFLKIEAILNKPIQGRHIAALGTNALHPEERFLIHF